MSRFLNEEPFQHRSRFGTVFTASRCDFADDSAIKVLASSRLSQEQLLADTAEMIGYHAICIHPELNGFAGYDTLKYVISRT